MTGRCASGSLRRGGRAILSLVGVCVLWPIPAVANCTVETVEKLVAVKLGDKNLTEDEISEIQKTCDWNVGVNACTFRRVIEILRDGGDVKSVQAECDK